MLGDPCHVGPKAVLLVPHISLPLCLRHPFLGGSDFIPESDQAVDTTLFSQFPIYPQMPTCDTSKILSFPILPSSLLILLFLLFFIASTTWLGVFIGPSDSKPY